MRNEVELYINGQLVELGEDFDVNMTYTVEQTKNPTAIKNNYSKTVTIPATGKNNKLFNNIWNVTSIYNNDFDLTKKANFQIFINGNKIEEGYIKIDKIKKTRTSANYECTLYGGLGDFFYSLSTDGEGGKLTLSDLDYGGGDMEFDIMVDKDFVYNAWNNLMNGTTENTIYDDINFAVSYNGIPENFSSDKVLINRRKQGPYNIPEYAGGGDYKALRGWVLADLKQEYDEWASRDLRSYLQRPVFRVKTLFRGICKPENNGGYTVNLDSDFFNSNNPYYEKSWITLPLISEMEELIEGAKPTEGMTVEIGTTDASFNRNTLEFKEIPIMFNMDNATNTTIILPFKLKTYADSACTVLMTGNKYTLNGSFMYYNAPITVQLVGYDKDDGDLSYYSDIQVFTSYNDLDGYNYSKLNSVGAEIIHMGNFAKSGTTTTYLWDTIATLRISNVDDVSNYNWYIRLSRYEYRTNEYISYYGNNHYLDCVWVTQGVSGNLEYSNKSYDYVHNKAYATTFNIADNCGEETPDDIAVLNKRKLTKKRMLSSDKTPLDYLLGYTKQMGLYFIKHPQEKVIDIVTRKTFYGKRNIINLEELIDRGKEINITPLTFDRKWYDMGLEIEENRYSKIYDTYTGIPYGTKRIDTGYEYVKDSTQLLNGNAYKAGLMVREKNAYMVNFRLPKDE